MDKDILTLEEVAQYLRVSERTVYDWAQKGELPAGKIGTAWRFKRKDIERWVDKKLTKQKSAADLHPVNISRLLTEDRILFLKSKNKRDALVEMIDSLDTAPEITNRDDLEDAIFQREELMSTGIGMGIAIPHVRIPSVKDLVMAVGIAKDGIKDYQSLDNITVQLIIMLAAGEDQHAYYLKTLSYISSKLKEKEDRNAILEAHQVRQVYDILTGQEG